MHVYMSGVLRSEADMTSYELKIGGNTQHTIPGVSFESRQRLETSVRVDRGERSCRVAFGRIYRYVRHGFVWAWVLFFRKNIIMPVRVHSSCEVRVARYQNPTRRGDHY